MNRAKFLLAGSLSAALLSLSACGTLGGGQADASADPKIAVASRAEARWQALIDGKVAQAYEYLSPATRKVMSRDVYAARIKPGIWRAAKATEVKCDADLCKATVLVKYDFRDIKGLEANMEETWIKEEGGWWYVQKK